MELVVACFVSAVGIQAWMLCEIISLKVKVSELAQKLEQRNR